MGLGSEMVDVTSCMSSVVTKTLALTVWRQLAIELLWQTTHFGGKNGYGVLKLALGSIVESSGSFTLFRNVYCRSVKSISFQST